MKTNLIFLIFVVVSLTACVPSNIDTLKNKNVKDFMANVIIKDDQFETTVSARIKDTINYVLRGDVNVGYQEAKSFSRCMITKSEIKESKKLNQDNIGCQIYVSTQVMGRWAHLDRVNYVIDGEAKSSELRRIGHDVNCQKGSCGYMEDVAIDLFKNKELLNSILEKDKDADKAYYFKLKGRGGSLKAAYVASALKANINALLLHINKKYNVQVELIN